MTYREGNKVIYPRLGICRVAGVIEQSAGGTVVKCYSLKPLDSLDSTTILVPVSKAVEIGVRKLIEKDDPDTCNHMVHKATDGIPCCRDRTDFCCESCM